MEWFPSTMTREESDAFVDRIEERFRDHGWGLWAVEVRGVAPFAGFIGLHPAESTLGYPAVEIGWRLAAAFWGAATHPRAHGPGCGSVSSACGSRRSCRSRPSGTRNRDA
jgi:RimJ/RimL family protein N-acetyltransferase